MSLSGCSKEEIEGHLSLSLKASSETRSSPFCAETANLGSWHETIPSHSSRVFYLKRMWLDACPSTAHCFHNQPSMSYKV